MNKNINKSIFGPLVIISLLGLSEDALSASSSTQASSTAALLIMHNYNLPVKSNVNRGLNLASRNYHSSDGWNNRNNRWKNGNNRNKSKWKKPNMNKLGKVNGSHAVSF